MFNSLKQISPRGLLRAALSLLVLSSLLIYLGMARAYSDDHLPAPTPSAVPAPAPTAVPEAAAPHAGPCGVDDPGCSRRISHILTGLNIGQVQVEGGVRFGEGPLDGAVAFRVNGVGMDSAYGNAHVLNFEAIYLPNQGGTRIRFSLIDTDVQFFCKDSDGHTHPPIAGLLGSCDFERGSIVGIGGHIMEAQWDSISNRWAARWAEVNAVFSMLGNGGTMNGTSGDYLHRRLNAFLGTSVDTVWPGQTPGMGSGPDTMLRLNMGVMGMLRTQDNHWEIRGYAGYRPDVTKWNDFAIETQATVMYHFMFSHDVMGTVGLDGRYTHWSVPGHSIGEFASDRNQDTVFVGLMFGVNFQ